MDTRIALSGRSPDVYGALMRGYQGAMIRQQDQQQQQDRASLIGAMDQRYGKGDSYGVLSRLAPEVLQNEQKQVEYQTEQANLRGQTMLKIAENLGSIPQEERQNAANYVLKTMARTNPQVAQAMMEEFTDLSDEGIRNVAMGYGAFSKDKTAGEQEFIAKLRAAGIQPGSPEARKAAEIDLGLQARPEPVETRPKTVGTPFANADGQMVQTVQNPDGTVGTVDLNTKQFRELPAYLGQDILKASDEYNTLSAKADKAERMAMEFAGQFSDIRAGVTGEVAEAMKSFFGTEDDVSAIRLEGRQMLNAETVAALPPGPATDRDISIMRAGFPKDFSNPKLMADWLGARARIARIAAAYQGFKSQYLSENENARGLNKAWLEYYKENPIQEAEPVAEEEMVLNGRDIIRSADKSGWIYKDTGEPVQ